MPTAVEWVVIVVVTIVVGPLIALIVYNIVNRFQSALPNEWLLLIKDGELCNCGVGISVFRGLNESVVTFPSLLKKVTFSAQQVSKEMQGVELSGFIVWVINRDATGPLKAYKHIKDLSNLGPDSDVNLHIKAMAESIVRSAIANLSINELISQRKKVRDAVRGGMQEVLTSWGIWLETIEVTNVKILSNSLFNDLQQPFRSSTRQMAEQIRIETDHDLQIKRVKAQSKMTRLRNEKDTETQIERSRMKLKQEESEQKCVEQREEIKRANIGMKEKTQILECQSNLEIQKQKQLIETQKINHNLKVKQMQYDFEMQKITDKYDVESKMTEVNMRKEILSTVENIYASMNVDSMKIVNFGQNQGLEHGIGKMAMALREVGNQLNADD